MLKRKIHNAVSAMTLVELLIATLIMVPVCIAVMYVFLQCMEYNDLARNTSTALRVCQKTLTQMETTSFDQIAATYHQQSFTSTDLSGRGVTYVDSSDPNYLKLTASFSWRQKNGRILGEDKDLDGVIDAGEDQNSNGMLDSPIMLTTYKYNL